MAPVVTGRLRPAGALSSTTRLIVELCCNHRMLGRDEGGVGVGYVGLGRRFWVLALSLEMALQDGFEVGVVSQRQRH